MSKVLPTSLIVLVIALALIGFADSAFLLAERISGAIIPCFITTGCDIVSKSPYSVLFGVPLSLWGMIFYLGIGLLALLYADTKSTFVAKLIPVVTTLGFLASLYFLYVQKFLIGTFCIYCIISAINSTALFGFGTSIIYEIKGKALIAKRIFLATAAVYFLAIVYILLRFFQSLHIFS